MGEYYQILTRMREKIQTRHYIVTLHAEEEMDDDEFSIFDVEHAILTGRIRERQRDRDSGEWKYCLTGYALDHREMEIIVKLSVTDKLVIITAYEL